MSGIFCYPDPAKRSLAIRLVNATGQSLDLTSLSFADNPSNVLIPLVKVLAPQLDGWQVCALPEIPHGAGPVVAFVELAGGSAPIDAPVPILSPAPAVLFGVGYTS